MCLLAVGRVNSQQLTVAQEKPAPQFGIKVSRWIDSIRVSLQNIGALGMIKNNSTASDTLLQQKLKGLIKTDTSLLSPNISTPAISKKTVRFENGYVHYDYNYRSFIDTPFREKGIGQHLVTGRFNFTVSDLLPVSVSYFGRQSNSAYFRDYQDVRVEFDPQRFRQLQAKKLNAYVEEAGRKLRNPALKPGINYGNKQIAGLESWLNSKETVNRLKTARVALASGGLPDTATNRLDTSLQVYKEFLVLYDKVKNEKKKIEAFRDSLQQEYIAIEKGIAAVKKISAGNLSLEEKGKAIGALLKQRGMDDPRMEKLTGWFSGIRSLGIGRVSPSYSDLTLKNINVNGINFEYNRKIYLAFTAGAIDYRARDFFATRQKGKPQFVYLARVGYGRKEGSHVYLSAYKGKKQLLSSRQNGKALQIYGLSLESQLVINRNHRLVTELAQSASPRLISNGGPDDKGSFDFGDKKNKAWSVQLHSNFPKTRSRLEGYYRYRGIDFQNFSSYYLNAATKSWQLKGEQYLWQRQIRLQLSVSKNNFENDLLPVRYSGNTSFKTFQLYFKRKKWPSLQAGYMPSSQLSEIDGQIFQNYFHTMNVTASHVYKIGLARGMSVTSYNRFYNDSRDSGFIYFNAGNFYLSQHIQFLSYAANLNATRSRSRDYNLTVFDAGISTVIKKISGIGFGIKINQLNADELRTGVYGSGKVSIKNLGELSVWIEKSYLPGWKGNLIKNEFYTIGFTRQFN